MTRGAVHANLSGAMSEQNLLLDRFPPDVRKRLVQRVESISLRRGQVLFQAGAPVPYAFFPMSGCVSLESSALSITTLALTTVGKEGMVGVSIVLREPTAPYAAVLRADGHACRLDAKDLLAEVDRSPAFRHTLLEYAASVFVQISQAANCVSAHNALQRLCRWLLSVDDHLQTGAIEISQDDLGLVLGVTRPVVARAMFELQKADAIWFARGRLLLRNRARLEASACECYSAPGPGPRPSTRRTSSHLA
jgi:CRP-like cAMP-binding protein